MVLKTESDLSVRSVRPPAGHCSGSVQSLDQMETKPRLDCLNRQSNRWTGRTSRFWVNQRVQMILIFFFCFPNAPFQSPYSNFQNEFYIYYYAKIFMNIQTLTCYVFILSNYLSVVDLWLTFVLFVMDNVLS